jgi:hypothetical protein
METKHKMELLLARMNASIKEHMQEMTAKLNAKMDANQAYQARMEANIESNQTNEIHSLCHAVRVEGDHPT